MEEENVHEDKPEMKRITCAAWKCEETVYGMGVCKAHFEEWNMESIEVPVETRTKVRNNRNQ
ncbi:hypothetical protein PV433_33440 [Paenibacillus sp. GYB004]|uniref:hypothetical protein n=1 Tax=Paenibacillus sp. GYB004 TaxID=2994393 RepID=UPI002F9692C5